MILKLYYQDEIHRISEPPTELSDLYTLVLTTFTATLPEQFSIFYTIAGEVENVQIKSQEDYNALLSMDPSKNVKVFIKSDNEARKPSTDYDIISKNDKTKEDDLYNEERKLSDVPQKRDLNNIVQDVTESVIIPQVQKYPYISNASNQENETTRKIVREVLQEQMPYIIAQVKEAVLKELRASAPVQQSIIEAPKRVPQYNLPEERKQPERAEKVEINPRPSEVIFERSEDVYGKPEEPERVPMVVENAEKNDLLNKMKKFGTALKDQLVVLPGKAKVAFDDLAQKMEGDPYVVCEGERFPKSVVDKAELLKEVFPEEDKKMLLHFVKQYPRNVTLEQLANLYLVKDEPQGEAQGEQQNA